MESHRLILEDGPRDAVWLVEWDDLTLALKAPDGRTVFEAPPALAHRVVGLHELYVEGKVRFVTPFEVWAFRRQAPAFAAIRGLVEAALAGDPVFLSELRRQAARSVAISVTMSVVGGGLFGLYCWWASWATDPQPEHWIWWLGSLIRSAVGVIMVAGLVGPVMTCFWLRHWLRLRRIGRRVSGGRTPA